MVFGLKSGRSRLSVLGGHRRRFGLPRSQDLEHGPSLRWRQGKYSLLRFLFFFPVVKKWDGPATSWRNSLDFVKVRVHSGH